MPAFQNSYNIGLMRKPRPEALRAIEAATASAATS
jgi:hypothetical protein